LRDIAYQTDVPYDIVCGVTAALSPSNKWERNVKDVFNLLTLEKLPKVATYGRNLLVALKILKWGRVDGILSGNKVVSFYDNLLREDSTEVTVDRHVWNAYMGERQIISESGPRLTERRYVDCSNAYREAAGMFGIKPYQMQAITWLVWRRLNGI
jgi:thermostable 8-oxoguanine DNA glycosylase